MAGHTVAFLSEEWVQTISITGLGMLSFLVVGSRLSMPNRHKLLKVLAFFMISITVFGHFFQAMNGNWLVTEELPLHLCGISNLICCVILFVPRKQLLFEFLFYCGIIGGLQALLTPLINNYNGESYIYFQFFFRHGAIIVFPLFMRFLLGMQLQKFSWFQSFLILNVLLLVIMPLNFALGSNYMYLAQPPGVNHVLVMGEWPYYILYWEFFIVALFYGCYFIFKHLGASQSTSFFVS